MPIFDHFSVLAPYYDKFIHRADFDELIELINLPENGKLLDVGGGTGQVAELLSNRIRSTVVADPSYRMLQQAAKKGGFELICSVSEALPFVDNSFERILMVDALHHVENQALTVKELWRVTKPGGRIVIEEPNNQNPAVWAVVILEKISLMRSHILSPDRLVRLFETITKKIEVKKIGYTVWLVVEK